MTARTTGRLRGNLSLHRRKARLWTSAALGDPVSAVLCLPRGAAGYARYERIRERGDLVRGRSGLYMTASHRICDEVLRSDAFGAVPTTVSKVRLRASPEEREGGPVLVHPLDDSFASVDPPDHTRLRKIVAPWFTPHALRSRRQFVEQVVAERLDRLAPTTSLDLISEFAVQVPSLVICDLLGLPTTDHDRFVRWGIEFGAIVDGARTPGEFRRTRALLDEMSRYFSALVEERRRHPGPDLVSRMVEAEREGAMTREGVVATSEALLIGGFVTTSNIIGNGVLALLAHPEQREVFTADLDQSDRVVEETLRLDAPAQYSVRIVRRACEVGGVELPVGTPVVTLLAAANRDPEVFPDPARFDLSRPNLREHLSFAAGIHYCIGAGLARMEGEIALRALFERFPLLRQTGPARYCPSRVIRGPMSLPMRCS
ncbi:cytochrome P450 [Yinghuangia sp. ASG 101]|uniref:cytochrome P450 n=1 Tax=Yinghuangia sp. ASG 101 TaxID=2896848 RepID=UPI001E293839|nr:cytochrome P450 [Yinghuangia sp. ASG 101]UGQ11308.1 cytochrome P450 [Yinghuangia sp. ASG 101]